MIKMQLAAFTTKTARKCKIFRLNGHMLSVDCCKVSILKERYEVCFSSFLECHDSRGLEAQVGLGSGLSVEETRVIRHVYTYLEILCDFTNETLEGQLTDEQLC